MSMSGPADKTTVKLHVLSPSLPRITFEDLATSITIRELKIKISETPSHPPIASQRLIYRGRPLVRDEMSLQSIFGQQTINESDDLTLHLVIPAVHPTSNIPHHTQIRTAPSPQLQSMPPVIVQSTTTQGFQHQGPNIQASNIPPTVSQPQPNPAQPAIPQAQIPPHLQQQIEHIHAAQAQLFTQMAAFRHHNILQGNMAQQNMTIGPLQANAFQQHAQQPPQQNPQQQQGSPGPNQSAQNTQVASPQLANLPQPHQHHVHAPPNVNTVHQIGPNGERYTTSLATVVHAPQPTQQYAATQNPRQGTPGQGVPDPSLNPRTTSIGPTVADAAQTLNANRLNVTREAEDIARLQQESYGNDASGVYILSSPSGPQALLVSPFGNYTTPWHVSAPTYANHLSSSTMRPNYRAGFPRSPRFLGQPREFLQSAHLPQQQAVNPQAQQMQLAQMPQQPNAPIPAVMNPQHAHQQQAQQARDLARILLPLAGHLWLFVRLFGFVWFFTHGASWTRTIFLCFVATIVFIGQSGFFRPLIQGLWEPIRRHADNLVPLGGNERPNAPAGPHNANASSAQGSSRYPTPQDTAQRLLDETQRQNGNVVRRLVRRCERAIALFVASLAPGVAERHIQAREAEAARQRELREREEREMREREGAHQQQENAAADGASSTSHVPAEGAASSPSPDAQPPLIEV